MTQLPEDLAPMVIPYEGPGVVIYPNKGARKDSLSSERLDELTAEGWVTKSIRYISDADGSIDVEQDPETGDWYEMLYGEKVPEDRICVNYLSTEKAHSSGDALRAMLDRAMGQARESLQHALKLAQELGLPYAEFEDALEALGES